MPSRRLDRAVAEHFLRGAGGLLEKSRPARLPQILKIQIRLTEAGVFLNTIPPAITLGPRTVPARRALLENELALAANQFQVLHDYMMQRLVPKLLGLG